MPTKTVRSFTFDTIIKPEWLLINKTHRPLAPKIEGSFIKVPKRAGAYFFGKSTDMRTISFDVTIMGDDELDLWKKAEWVSNWLTKDEPKELVINDEPDRIYYALLMDETELDDIAAMGEGTITFVCPDPFKYGSEYTQDIIANPSILNDANAELYPTFEVTFTEPQTHFAVTNGEETLLVGTPEEVETTKIEKYQKINSYSLNTLTGWTAAGTRIDGTVAGTMAIDPAGSGTFKASSYGTGSGWHGPALKTSISEELQDFKIEAFGYLNATSAAQVGKIEIYLKDVNGKIIAKAGIKDMHKDYENNWGEIRLGEATDPTYIINDDGKKMGYFNDFSGKVSIERRGIKWFVGVFKYDWDLERYTRYKRMYHFDIGANHMEKIAQIELAILANGTYAPVATAKWDYVNVWKINPLTTETNILFKAGDTLTVDNAKKAIFINGEPRNDQLSFDSDFISLKPGPNPLAISPATGITANAIYRKRWR